MKIKTPSPDYILIIVAGLLVVFGLVMLSSAGAVLGYQKFDDSYFFFKRQFLFGFLPGIFLAIFLAKVDYHYWRRWASFLFFLSIIFLFLVFIPGIGADYGTRAKSWINFSFISFQPGEIVKFTLILYLANFLERQGVQNLKNFYFVFLPFIFCLGAVLFLIALQPDLGTMLIVLAIAFSLYYFAGGKITHLAGLFTFCLFSLMILVKIQPYRLERLTTFLHPNLDPKGIGYQINQALLAIGSGGLFGRGFGQSRQKYQYLPEVTGDSIFAIIAEELGFILSIAFISLYFLLAFRGFSITQKAPDEFGRLLAFGITVWFIWQSIVNIGAMVGIMPLTGVPLPFVSYGATAMMVNLAAIGLLVNISKFCKH